MEMRQSGHIPAALDAIVKSDMGMIRPARGTAIRFVSRKYWGKVLKYSQARGPVVIWQEMDMDALSQIFLIGPFPSSGHNPFRCGCMNAIPAMAA